MAQKPREREGNRFGRWTLAECLGVGGNGEAWLAQSEDGETRVVKILNRHKGDGFARFKREIETVQRIVPLGFPALPIEESYLPERPSRNDKPYYVSPRAVRIDEAFSDVVEDSLGTVERAKVAAVRDLAQALADLLRDEGVHHRDVKPANLYEHDGRYVFGDFGLVTDPREDALALTDEGKILGPWAFLPSEVLNPLPGEPIDWEKVDVHCLALTLWCLIKGSEHPPRSLTKHGPSSLSRQLAVPVRPTNPDPQDPLEDPSDSHRRQYIGELDDILILATTDEPEDRPSLALFAQRLSDWEEGIVLRDDMQAYIEASGHDEELVLKWLVQFGRADVSLGRAMVDVDDLAAESVVSGLTNLRFSHALEGLKGRYLTVAEPWQGDRYEPRHWSRVYPTSHAIDDVERERVEGEVLPLLREIVVARDLRYFSFDGDNDSVALGSVTRSGAELYFLLRYMEESSLIDYEHRYEMNNGVTLSGVKATSIGRNWVLNRQ